MNPNILREWLAMYDQAMPGGRADSGTGYMWETQGARNQRNSMDAQNMAARRMMWAERMMGRQNEQGSPDFFGEEAPGPQMQYVRPERFNESMPPETNYLREMMMRRGRPQTGTLGVRG